MNPLLLGPLLEVGKSLIERFFPDEEAKRKAEAEFMQMVAAGELKVVLAQLEINAREAASPSIFVAGWRPAAGWCGVFGLFYSVLLQPLLTWYTSTRSLPAPPILDSDILLYVLGGMLGLGGLRSFEKSKGVSK